MSYKLGYSLDVSTHWSWFSSYQQRTCWACSNKHCLPGLQWIVATLFNVCFLMLLSLKLESVYVCSAQRCNVWLWDRSVFWIGNSRNASQANWKLKLMKYNVPDNVYVAIINGKFVLLICPILRAEMITSELSYPWVIKNLTSGPVYYWFLVPIFTDA